MPSDLGPVDGLPTSYLVAPPAKSSPDRSARLLPTRFISFIDRYENNPVGGVK